MRFLEAVTNYIDKGYHVDVIYMDFPKTFGKVQHRRLNHKLTAHGLGGKVGKLDQRMAFRKGIKSSFIR